MVTLAESFGPGEKSRYVGFALAWLAIGELSGPAV